MTFASSNMSNRSSLATIGAAITIFMALLISSIPARAGMIIHDLEDKAADAVQLAQLVLCTPPKQLINGRCQVVGRSLGMNPAPAQVCLPPKRMIRGVCKLPGIAAPVLQPQCLPPKRMVRGVCKLPRIGGAICRAPKRMIRGVCRLPIVGQPPIVRRCLPPKRMIRGVCKLPGLIPPVRPCLPPKRIIRGVCKLPVVRPPLPPIVSPCPPPGRMIRGVCKVPGVNVCRPPKRWVRGVCKMPVLDICKRPRVWRGGRCVLPNPTCRPPYVRSPFSGRCYLPIDIDPIPENECRSPWFYSPEAGGCVKPRPQPRPKENILWIQSCLNTLGYGAGTEDGVAGRQTRAAWETFRDAVGLTGFVEFSDPETLANLYKQCTPPKVSVAPPQCPPSTGGQSAGCASGLEYRPSLCATGKLYISMTKKFGNSIALEQCGRSCLPVPEGMEEAEALRLQSEQGINWCKDCIKVGNEGLLCPTPRPLPAQ